MGDELFVLWLTTDLPLWAKATEEHRGGRRKVTKTEGRRARGRRNGKSAKVPPGKQVFQTGNVVREIGHPNGSWRDGVPPRDGRQCGVSVGGQLPLTRAGRSPGGEDSPRPGPDGSCYHGRQTRPEPEPWGSAAVTRDAARRSKGTQSSCSPHVPAICRVGEPGHGPLRG